MIAAVISDAADRPEKVGVVMWMSAAGGEPLGPVVEWPAKKGFSPMWNSARTLVQTRPSADGSPARLHVELWGIMDDSSRELIAGPVEFSPAKLPMRPQNVALNRSGSGEKAGFEQVPPASLTLHALSPPPQAGPLLPAPPGKKLSVFFVRHGESKWNAAKRGHNVYKMVREHDHPLTEKGYEQALALQHAIRAAIAAPRAGALSTAQQMAEADALWASPLTRALQTALVALEPVLRQPSRKLEIKLNVREKKNFGGLDSIGRVCGAECYQRALSELRSLDDSDGGPSAVDVDALSSLTVDPAEVAEEWWVSEGAEDSKSLDDRLSELLHQIEHADAERIVIVGHSHYYRAFFKRFLHPAFFQRDAGLAKTLQTKSVPNCCVLSCELDFSLRPYPVRNVAEIHFNPVGSTDKADKKQSAKEAKHGGGGGGGRKGVLPPASAHAPEDGATARQRVATRAEDQAATASRQAAQAAASAQHHPSSVASSAAAAASAANAAARGGVMSLFKRSNTKPMNTNKI